MIDWKKPIRTTQGEEKISDALKGYIIHLENLLSPRMIENARLDFSVENIPEPEAQIEKKDCEHLWGVLCWCKGESSYEIGKVTEQAGEFYCMKCLKRKTRLEFLAGY